MTRPTMPTEVSKRLPNFIHAGVPKSASATIRTVLQAHPDVFVPRQKEPNFFARDNHFALGSDWYSATYFADSNGARILGDLSIGYSTGFGFDVPHRIVQMLGADMKILLTFRDPIARAYSQYRMAREKGQIERLEFAEAIDRAIRIAPEVSDADRLRSRTGTYYASERDMDVFRWCMYIEPGHYGAVHQAWASKFGAQNVLVLLTHDIAHDLQAQANELFRFLGVEPIVVQNDVKRNQATKLKYPFVRRGLNTLYGLGPLRGILTAPHSAQMRKFLRRWLLSYNYVPDTSPGQPDYATAELLARHYAPEVARLETILGRNLNPWRSNASTSSSTW